MKSHLFLNIFRIFSILVRNTLNFNFNNHATSSCPDFIISDQKTACVRMLRILHVCFRKWFRRLNYSGGFRRRGDQTNVKC